MTEAERKVSFVHQKVGKRAAVVVAGPLANFVLAIVIFAGLFMVYGKPSTSRGSMPIMPDSAAAAAGFQPGDVVLSIDGRTIDSFADMQRIVSTSAGETLTVVVKRGDSEVHAQGGPGAQGGQGQFRQCPSHRGSGHQPLDGARRRQIRAGRPADGRWPRRQGNLVRDRPHADLYRRRDSPAARRPTSSGGPIRIAQVSGQVATAGFSALMHLAAVLSVSIGLLNLFPVPLLDGGHLLFYAIEAVPRPAAVGAGAGIRLPDRACDRGDVDDLCHLQRHRSHRLTMDSIVM